MRVTLHALVCVLLCLGVAYAQSDRGTITGTITDPSGSMIANAPIEAKNMQTGVVYRAASSETGNYTLAQLPTGTYQITCSLSGFKQFVRTGVTVSTAQILRIDVMLEVGAITETVTVNADAPLLKTESGELSHVITSSTMDELPMINISQFGIRNTFSSVNLLPGAGEVQNPGSFFGTVRVNGLPGGTQTVRIEGQDATETTWSAAYNMSMPGLDSMEETAIQTSNYSAEFGQSGGAIFNMTMRSGTNNFHGSAYEYLRNDALNARQPFNHQLPVDKRHDYGFTIGGPVIIPHFYNGRDKTFFFFSFEQNRQRVSVAATNTIPTLAMRSGDFSDPALYTGKQIGTDILQRPIMNGAIYDPATTRDVVVNDITYTVRDPFPGNIMCDKDNPTLCGSAYLAKYGDPVALKLQSFLPDPTSDTPTNNYFHTYPNAPVTSIPSIKMDHNLSPTLKLSGSWSMTDIKVPFPDGFPAEITSERDLWETTHTARINLDYTITPTMLLHLGGGYMGFEFYDPSPTTGKSNNLQVFGLPGTYVDIVPTINGLLGANGQGMGAMTPAIGSNFGPNAQSHQWAQKPTGTATLSWVKGNHTYKFGGEFRGDSFPSSAITPANGSFAFAAQQTALPYLNTTSTGGGSIGFPYASFLLGMVNTGAIGQVGKFHLGKHALGFFAQDTWKATRKLTIDYGLRYDYETYMKNNGMIANWGFDVPNPAYGDLPGAAIFEGYGPNKCNCDLASNYPYNFGPRLGIAYQINQKTVFRGGIGLSYAQTAALEMISLAVGSNVGYGPSTTYGLPISQLKDGPPIVPVWPNFYTGQIPATQGGSPSQGAVDRHAGYPPRMLMWSIGIQRELSKDMVLDVSYVGNRGAWWNSDGVLTDPNRVSRETLTAHNFDSTLTNATDNAVLLQQFGTLTPEQIAHYNLSKPYASFQGTVSQSLRPYPQAGNLLIRWAPLGNSWYDSLQVKFTKRYSHGLSMTASYSFQKEMVVGPDTQNPAFMVGAPIVNLDNLRSNKSLSGLSIPHRLVVAGNYITPAANVYKPLSWIMRDWNIGAYLVYQSGYLIPAPTAINSAPGYNPARLLSLSGSAVHSFGNAGYAARVPGVPLYTADINSHYDPFTTFVLNPDAWTQPDSGQFGNGVAYYNDYRYRRVPTENMSLARIFRLREKVSLQLRVEMQNVFNRTRISNPSNQLNVPQTWNAAHTSIVSGFGYANAINATGQRSGQIVARITF
jgi:hypothetical protein